MITSRRGSKLLRWWRSIDNRMFMLVMVVIAIGAILTATASPAVAERIGVHPLYFINKQLIFLIASVGIICTVSMMDKSWIRKLSPVGFVISAVLLVVVLFIGNEAKGATRWLNILGFSLQPSELLKPFYAVVIGYILAEGKKREDMPSFRICLGLHAILVLLLLLQPDFGMAMTISVVTLAQFFIAGISVIWLILAIGLCLATSVIAYMLLPHVAKRVQSFLGGDDSGNYQVERSLESHIEGGFLGKGPGEGSVKLVLPDAHTDFIFAVAGEELGAIFCIILIMIFAAIVIIGLLRIAKNNELFSMYSAVGILIYFAMQSAFNMGVTLNLFPTKGVTLPFISYGGSSVLSCALSIGIYLSLTKKNDWFYAKSGKR